MIVKKYLICTKCSKFTKVPNETFEFYEKSDNQYYCSTCKKFNKNLIK